MREIVILLGALLALFGLPAYAFVFQTSSSQSEVTKEEYAVYNAVIGDMFAGSKVTFDTQAEVKLLVINDHTTSNLFLLGQSDETSSTFRQELPLLVDETMNDYRTKNKGSEQLKPAFDLKIKYTLVEKQVIDLIFKHGPDGWPAFYKKYPDSGGYLRLSRVGFNRKTVQALIYVEHGCGGLCGTGHYVFLVKGQEGWKVNKKIMAWIS